ncbi:MBL fold metallo-hydrolase [Mucilaginibacter sp. KACC 22063]|uniref:MBL fold metallo-hydrolase n=1 Tax=Mucilaginibacter sp. KACC 22063 TaxID=3025666 RepID=UPI002365C116|nr:MBL fold metallo-hydrolase [Mucilaginibacter sp. KACC 22063]WDF56496.1 MBL fold metallo-hydrolase [Mucilaginibacter sp. KACC 22063]
MNTDILKGSRKEGKKFVNLVPTDAGGLGVMFPILWEYITNKEENIPKKALGPFKTDASIYDTPSESGLRVTWIGHSSLLIEIDGKRILTDPVWSQRVSFSQRIGPKRFFDAPLLLKDLPALDAVLISHDHYDHLDTGTIKYLAKLTVPFICSIGVGQYLQEWGVSAERITEMDWGSVAYVGDVSITSTPSRHFAGRSLSNRNETLWASFVIKGPKHNIYFGADSGWFDGFKVIGDTYGPFDLTMLEVGAYGKHWPDIHMGPDNAANAHEALRGKVMMPIHWGTFSLAPHAWYAPIERLEKIAKEKNIVLFSPEPGQPTDVTDKPLVTGWWRKFR